MVALHSPTASVRQSGGIAAPRMVAARPVATLVKCGFPWIVHLPARSMVNVMKNSAAPAAPTMSPVGVPAASTSITYSPGAYPGFKASPTSLASLTAKDPPPVGATPTLAAAGFDETDPAAFGSPRWFAGILMIVMDDLPVPLSTCALAAPATASDAAMPTAIMTLVLRINFPSSSVWVDEANDCSAP